MLSLHPEQCFKLMKQTKEEGKNVPLVIQKIEKMTIRQTSIKSNEIN